MKLTLKAARVNADLKQYQVAKTIGVDISTLSRYERGLGSPDVKVAKKLSELYGVPFDDLIFLSQNNALSVK